MERLLEKRQVASILGISVKAVNKWMAEGKLPYIRLSRKCVRFQASDIAAYVR